MGLQALDEAVSDSLHMMLANSGSWDQGASSWSWGPVDV